MVVDANLLESSSTTSTISPTATRHPDLWFRDGNIVLATHTLLFRVHKSILSMHSSVFRDMFELAGIESCVVGDGGEKDAMGRTTEHEMYDGVPLVSLPSDEGVDVEELLLAVYDRLYVFSVVSHC